MNFHLYFREILCINYIQINPFVNPFNIERTTQREIPETTATTTFAPRTTTRIPFSREDDRRVNLALKTSSSKSSNSNKKLDSDQRDQRNENKKQSKHRELKRKERRITTWFGKMVAKTGRQNEAILNKDLQK